MTCGIYKLIAPNGKIYIGQSLKIEQRWADHKRRAKNKFTKSSFKLYNSIRKYGWEFFTKEIIEQCPPELLNGREIYYINLFDSFKHGLNGREGGDSNWKVSQTTKNKLRKANLGKYNGDQNIQFTIDGILYCSVGDASKKLGIPAKTIHNRLNSNNEKYSNYLYYDSKLIPKRFKRSNGRNKKIVMDGKVYESIACAIKQTSISKSTILYRLRNGTYSYVS